MLAILFQFMMTRDGTDVPPADYDPTADISIIKLQRDLKNNTVGLRAHRRYANLNVVVDEPIICPSANRRGFVQFFFANLPEKDLVDLVDRVMGNYEFLKYATTDFCGTDGAMYALVGRIMNNFFVSLF